MERVDKTVFISYRRTNFPWAMLIYQHLTGHGYDVFIDYYGIPSGDFETYLLENLKARAHFVVLLTPSALENCSNPDDWMRREVEAAIRSRRNIVPLMLEGFNFGAQAIAKQLTGALSPLKRYQALQIHNEYFMEGMERLRSKYLNVPLTAVIHPPSEPARLAAIEQRTAAEAAPPVEQDDLAALQFFEQAFATADADEAIKFFGEAIRLKPDYAEAYFHRASTEQSKGSLEEALEDYEQAILLKPNDTAAYNNRGVLRKERGDLDGALADYNEAIRINPEHISAHYNRAQLYKQLEKNKAAVSDLQRYLSLGGGRRDGDTEDVERTIRQLREQSSGLRPKLVSVLHAAPIGPG